MEQQKIIHLISVPFTGLGLYSGWRGNRWLKNRIQIFKQFVIPSLQAQTSKNFVLHCCWRREEKTNFYVKELMAWLDNIKEFKTIHTFHGILFYDDKHPDDIARDRLITSLHGSIGELVDTIGEVDYVYISLQPSDDCYISNFVENIQKEFRDKPHIQAIGYEKGYIMNYRTKEVANYDPKTNPPFYTIKFPRDIFIDPFRHSEFTGIKYDFYNKGKYPQGCPLPSHEYLKDVFGDKYLVLKDRGFVVGVHGTNISTHFNIPFRGEAVSQEVLKDFGVYEVPPLKIRLSIKQKLLMRLPHWVQRKLRYYSL